MPRQIIRKHTRNLYLQILDYDQEKKWNRLSRFGLAFPPCCGSTRKTTISRRSTTDPYQEPSEHHSALSRCHPLSISAGWPQTPGSFGNRGPPTQAPHTRPTVCRMTTVAMLGHSLRKARTLSLTRTQHKYLENQICQCLPTRKRRLSILYD